jgi:ketosteroid isomerase-like protein
VIQIMSVIIQNCSLRNGGSINGFEHYTELSWQSGNMWADTHSFVLHKVDIEVPGNLAHCTAFSFLGSMSLDCYPCYFT